MFALIEAAPSDFGVVADGCVHHAVKRGIAAFDAVFKIFVAFQCDDGAAAQSAFIVQTT